MKAEKLLKRLRVGHSGHVRLSSFDCADTFGFDIAKSDAQAMLTSDVERLRELQKRFYADGRWAVLVVLQGMDTAGKDGVISHVMSGVNPQGCQVQAFKAPSAEELQHDFLWRATSRLPARGRIGIFNRSYYEETLVVRVHPDLLDKQRLPQPLVGKDIWQERFKDIRAFERHLARSGVVVLKFFLHISKEEQRKRLLARLDEPHKRWKFSMGDIAERKLWDKYMAAYEDVLGATSRKEAPWYVVPADQKWFARLVVAAALVEALQGLDLQFPKIEGAALEQLDEVRGALLADQPASAEKPRSGEAKQVARRR
jgi:PPK2 family polyphosphate:nucleotide phosphotransferase